MKKLLFIFSIVIFNAALVFTQNSEPQFIEFSTPFRLNPILGINGDDYESSSKFVQRMIYSPLVFPLQDPYLQDNFDYNLELSLIESLAYSQDNVNWTTLDMNNSRSLTSGSGYIYYRVKLRDGLNFYQQNTARAYDPVSVQDVVYSYRISRITMDRKYRFYMNDTNRKLGLNTLMYSRIRNFKNVYCRDDRSGYVYFVLDSNRTGEQFLKLLVFVPILSSKQMTTESVKMKGNSPSPEYRSIHREDLDMVKIFDSGEINNEEYNFYDINKILLVLDNRGEVVRTTSLGEQFFKSPIGYGQFVFTGRPEAFGRDPDLWTSVNLVRNPNWCNFGNPVKIIGGEKFDHNNYRNNTARFIVKYRRELDPRPGNDKKILYNVPLSACYYIGSTGSDQLRNDSLINEKMKMQISHSLYGIFFGPDLSNSQGYMYDEARIFFSYFADRVRMENILKYSIGEANFMSFDSEIRNVLNDSSGNVIQSLIEGLQVQRLYFPFFTATQERSAANRSLLGRYYDSLQNNDELYQKYYRDLGEQNIQNIERYYRNMSFDLRQDFYNDFVGGKEFPGNILSNMDFAFNNARRYIIASDGQINIEIVYRELNATDSIGVTIASRFKETLDDYFRLKNIRAVVNLFKIDDYSRWRQRAIDNSRSGKNSLLVKGWNYKFDLLDDINSTQQFISRTAFNAVRNEYVQMIRDSNRDTENIVQSIAQQFVNHSIMIPLIGIQNYAVFNRAQYPGFIKYKDKIEIILLPFYWD